MASFGEFAKMYVTYFGSLDVDVMDLSASRVWREFVSGVDEALLKPLFDTLAPSFTKYKPKLAAFISAYPDLVASHRPSRERQDDTVHISYDEAARRRHTWCQGMMEILDMKSKGLLRYPSKQWGEAVDSMLELVTGKPSTAVQKKCLLECKNRGIPYDYDLVCDPSEAQTV